MTHDFPFKTHPIWPYPQHGQLMPEFPFHKKFGNQGRKPQVFFPVELIKQFCPFLIGLDIVKAAITIKFMIKIRGSYPQDMFMAIGDPGIRVVF